MIYGLQGTPPVATVKTCKHQAAGLLGYPPPPPHTALAPPATAPTSCPHDTCPRRLGRQSVTNGAGRLRVWSGGIPCPPAAALDSRCCKRVGQTWGEGSGGVKERRAPSPHLHKTEGAAAVDLSVNRRLTKPEIVRLTLLLFPPSCK